ncbi:MAG: glycosyltransferase, partial [Clostridia bacterium]|nr:glycosyltransferase [Clostridia bacterium]
MVIVEILIRVINFISSIVSNIYKYKKLFVFTGLFVTRKFKKAKKNHKYAILIAARNEEEVIGNLIDSIRKQDYPAELVDVFVVADNCTDSTAKVARDLGAVCYERQDTEHRTKGFALQFLVECIRRDFGIDSYEGYMIFDADNLLQRDFVARMNDAFDAGEKIVTSYRNTKNFDDNWISASYGLHWLRTVR